MIDLNDNAKAAVREFAGYVGQTKHCERYLERIVPKQTKTVADAVKEEKHWKVDFCDFLGYNLDTKNFVYGSRDKWASHEQPVCTRDEFESYVKEQDDKQEYPPLTQSLIDEAEQEGEKWTHVHSGVECRIKIDSPDCDGYLVVITKAGRYLFCKPEQLKPIKTTISKAEAWDKLLQTDEKIRKLDDAIFAIADKYEII